MDLEFEEGMWISRSGFAKRASTWADCAEEGVRARFLVGRCERLSAEVGMDSGIGSDMAVWVRVSGRFVRISRRRGGKISSSMIGTKTSAGGERPGSQASCRRRHPLVPAHLQRIMRRALRCGGARSDLSSSLRQGA